MEDSWVRLCSATYDADVAFDDFAKWVQAPKRSSRAEKSRRASEFLKSIMPLVGRIMRRMFRPFWNNPNDCDDICAELSIALLQKGLRHRERLLQKGWEDVNNFTNMMRRMLRNLLIDIARREIKLRTREYKAERLHRPLPVSVPKQVDTRLILEELPDRIVAFAVQRDRLGFGEQAIGVVARLLVSGKEVRPDMLRNWIRVANADRCIAFVMLMARYCLYQCKAELADALTPEVSAFTSRMNYHFCLI